MHKLMFEIGKGAYNLEDVIITLQTIAREYANSIGASITKNGYKITIHSSNELDEQDIKTKITEQL